MLEEKITAAVESRVAGSSLFARFSVSTVGLEPSEKSTTNPLAMSSESSNRNQWIYKMTNKTRHKLYFATILDWEPQRTTLTTG